MAELYVRIPATLSAALSHTPYYIMFLGIYRSQELFGCSSMMNCELKPLSLWRLSVKCLQFLTTSVAVDTTMTTMY